MIVISNVERSQLKFFRPKGHVEDSLPVIDTFRYAFSGSGKRMRPVQQDSKQDLSKEKEGQSWSRPQISSVVTTKIH